ncbi:MAG TPA: sensor domain-containing diguanylate cyclase [Blastocatellia bacterium]|nr:sensor domain-containing diguanylate cyclase [Blastocatellia bacterium]
MKLHDSLEANEIVAEAIKLLSSVTPADVWALYLKATQADRIELVRAINSRSIPLSPFMDLGSGRSPLVRAINERRMLVGRTDQKAARRRQGDVESEGAELYAPLYAGQRLVGAVHAMRVDGSGQASAFSQEEARLVELLCGAIARALANAIEYQNATRQSLIDDLTRLYNVRYFYQALDSEIRRARRYGSSVSVIFMDLDGFKRVNDAYGHRAGSLTLAEVARVILNSMREVDFVARYGGDEFIMMLPETPAKQALEAAERVRDQISRHLFSGGLGAEITITASFGVASFPEHAGEAGKLIELADAAMYEAKQREKNTVRIATP